MQPERWQRIQKILLAALDLPRDPPEEREAYLRAECGDDVELLGQVHSLLAAHDENPDYLETPAAEIVPWTGAGGPGDRPGDATVEGSVIPPDPLVGARAGPFRIQERIGSGGMGTVYLAARDDDQYQQEVAIKVLKHGLESGELQQRFRQERQILAALDHPALTRLLDGGVLPDGRPYLVMEKVDGRPIDTHCREQDLSLRARLELFRAVCDAVAYAHRNLVVHRDLKPSNVLVQPDGRVKLLDFGIAKLLASDPLPDAAPPTRADWRLLTPEYASPEQLRGEPVTTAADVFALGVLLYELLTDAHPFRRSDTPPHEVALAITGADPARPSTRATPARRQLRGDLDTIVLKALRKDPERRYPSVEALSEDLRRYLRGHPVQARGEGLVYRLGKFTRRNWPVVTATTAVFVLLLGFVLVLGGQNRRIARQSRTIVQEKDRAEQMTSVLVGMFDVSDPYSEQVRADTLRVRDFLRQSKDRLLTEVEDRPDLGAQVAQLMSRFHVNLGLFDEALPLSEHALEISRDLYGDTEPEVARNLDHLGTIHQSRGDLEIAIRYFREGLALRRKLLEAPHPELAESLNNLGIALVDAGLPEEAESLHRESLAMRRQLFGDRGIDVAQSLNTLAVLEFRQGNLEESERLNREALSIRREVLGEVHPYVGNLLNNLARCVQDQGKLAQADTLLREAVAIWEVTLGEEHPSVSAGLYNLGRLAAERGEWTEAIGFLRRSNEHDRRNYPADHPYVADSASALGGALLAADRAAEAEPLLREAVTIYTERRGAEDPDAVEARDLLGACLTRRGRYAAAETTLTATLDLLARAGADTSAAARAVRGHLVDLYTAWDRPAQAAVYREAR